MAVLSAIKLPNNVTYTLKDNGALQLTGGKVTGPVTFGDSVSIDDATIGNLVVNGSASFTNNIQANTINGVAVGSNPKFTDTNTVTTATTTGSGNAVTAITASNGALTVTKGTTFLTAHQTVTNKGATLSWGTAVTVATIGGTNINVSLPSNPNTNTTYTFANGTNGFTVTPSGGTAQTVTVTPSITNNITGSGTSGYIAKFNGAHTLTNGPAIGTGTTKFLREDGTWATPTAVWG